MGPPFVNNFWATYVFFVSDVLIFYFRSSKYDIRVLREKMIYVEYRKYVYLQKKIILYKKIVFIFVNIIEIVLLQSYENNILKK